MAGKNHHRYKIRKRMNSIKHEERSLFNEPPLIINSWEELDKLETDKYIIGVDNRWDNGWVKPKVEMLNDEEYWKHNQYLSTHTFYGSQYFQSTAMLRSMGFNVQLVNWDGETLYCR